MPLAAGHFFAGTVAAVGGGGGATGDHHQTDNFNATSLQTAFSMSQTPIDINDVEFSVNGVKYTNGTDFSVAGLTATWNDVFFLGAGDMIIIDYPAQIPVEDHHQTDVFTAAASQTAFTLSRTPVDDDDVELTVNGIEYTNGTDFSASGTSITWNDILFTLESGDIIILDYDF